MGSNPTADTYCIPSIFVRLRASVKRKDVHIAEKRNMTPVGFEPTQLALVELESTPLDHSGKVSCCIEAFGLLGAMLKA